MDFPLNLKHLCLVLLAFVLACEILAVSGKDPVVTVPSAVPATATVPATVPTAAPTKDNGTVSKATPATPKPTEGAAANLSCGFPLFVTMAVFSIFQAIY